MFNGDKERNENGLQSAVRCARERQTDIFYIHEPYANLKDVFRPEDVIIFFRDPVQRMLSHYQHRVRSGGTESFEQFVIQKRDLQSLHARDLALDRAFVGIVEHYTESIQRLSVWLDRDLNEVSINRNPYKVYGETYLPTDAELALVLECNRNDIELYERVRRDFDSPQRSMRSWMKERQRRRRSRRR